MPTAKRHRDPIGDLAITAAAWLDGRPWAPAAWAERCIDRFTHRRRARAALDPRWAAIEARRHDGESGGTVLLNHDLTLADWDEQNAIARRLTRPGPVVTLAFWLQDHTLATWAAAWAGRRQRAHRGWSDEDIWDLGHVLATRTADMLEALADTTPGWPSTEEFPTPEDWDSALRKNAAALRAWDAGDPEELLAWHTLATSRGAEAEAEVAHARLAAADQARYDAAKQAMTWVAEHLGQLWE